MNSNEKLLLIVFMISLVVFTYKKLNGFRNLRALFLSKLKQDELNLFFSKYFNYYNQLSTKEKKRFVFRANNLAKSTKIVGKQDFKITEKVKLFVVTAQVQLTFGFRNYSLPMFRTIVIYPNSYEDPTTGRKYYGEVKPKGLIVLSWKRLVRGYLIPDDKINLGLHELAHALMHTIIHSQTHELGLDLFLKNFLKLSKPEISLIRGNDHHFFRDYAGKNIFEFFAVSSEYFFEAPHEFKKELPQLYLYLTKLLKQDPALKIFKF